MLISDISSINLADWLLGSLPIVVLLVAMLGFRRGAPLAGTLALITAGLSGWLLFGASAFLLLIASAKGLSLSLFILLIIWSALFLYNLMHNLGVVEVIARSIARLSKSPLGQALLLGWAFSGFIEGIAGFGVAVAVLAPFMVSLNFSPLTAAAIVLVGHSWAVTYGALGSAYYTIQLATGIPSSNIGTTMAALFALPIMATGFGVAHIEGGWRSLCRGAPTILIAGAVMIACVWLTASLGVAQITAVVAGLIGCVVIWVLSQAHLLEDTGVSNVPTGAHLPHNPISFHTAFLPYYLLIFLTMLSQVPVIQQSTAHLYLAFDYSGTETSLGYIVAPVQSYARINLVGHPAPLIVASTAVTALLLCRTGHWRSGIALATFKSTFKQCVPVSLGIITTVAMALIMNDTGMTRVLASGIAQTTGIVFPVFSPYIGVLGCFVTGSNTNSNVMFGALQTDTARSLGISSVIIASVQSIGGSLGSSISPAKVLVSSGVLGLGGREGDVIHKTVGYCLLIVFLVGVEAWIAIHNKIW